MGTIHAGHVETSARLQATLQALLTGPKTTRELSEITGSVAPHSDVAALRQNGVNIPRAEYRNKTATGAKVYLYRLAEEGMHE